MQSAQDRRINALASHLTEDVSRQSGHECSTSTRRVEPRETSSSYDRLASHYPSKSFNVSWKGQAGLSNLDHSSVCRVHGNVSDAPVRWTAISSLYNTTLQEVLYHKSEGEGIAKVGPMNTEMGPEGL